MNCQYKVIVSNRSLYKEFEIDSNVERIKLGTTTNCELRLNAEYFFEDIEVEFEKKEDNWEILCLGKTYISRGNMQKMLSANIAHGDVIIIKYASSGENVFELRFLIDFEAGIPFYNWKINLEGIESLCIGDDEASDIVLKSAFSHDTQIFLNRRGNQYELEEKNTRFGMYINGQRIKGKSSISDYDFFSVADSIFYYKNGELYFDIRDIEISNTTVSVLDAQTNSLQYPLFNRSTRVKEKVSEEKITILDPPIAPTKPEQNIVMLLFPTLGMLALTIVVRGFMSSTSSSFILFSVCSMCMGLITSVWGFINNRKKYKEEIKKRIEDYTRYASDKREEIANKRQKELEVLNNTYHDLKKDAEIVMDFSEKLFERKPEDDDFLDVFLGKGVVKAKQIIDYKKKENFDASDELTDIPEQIAKEFEYIKDAPVILKLQTANAVGVVGTDHSKYILFKNMLLDVAIRQFYNDVQIFVLVEPDNYKYDWMLLLPHLYGENGRRNIIFDSESKTSIFEYLYKELSEREHMKRIDAPFLVIMILDEYGIKNHPVSRFIEKAAELNAVFVFFEDSTEKTPLNCRYIVELHDNEQGDIYTTDDKSVRQHFNYVEISDELADMLVRKLAPVYCEQISLESSLRRNISLFELLDIYNEQDLDLGNRWANSKIYESIAVPLGVNVKNEIVYLDLHEKAHGPHGLVAGTTGSGKSEILQSYILSAATLYHPYEIGFVIIDFKGGGMVNQFKKLPHLVGAITNIDGREIERSLKSIKAELLKRQTLFAEANVNHIDKYIRLYKERKVSEPLPHLVIIVDEFAELKAEQPEFMKELISAARIGRSLGIHLILATQKPAGQVNEQIWSNSRFKLCLKVQTKEDSKEVLKSPLAAEIREPGRAYLQVGNDEIFELFQSAYSGAPAVISNDLNEKEYVIYEVGYKGRERVLYQKKNEKKGDSGSTELEAIVNYIAGYCEKKKIERLPNICLPSLESTINYMNDSTDAYDRLSIVPVGIYDDPDTQYQGRLYTDIGRENTLIVGTAQMGKTNLLQLFIRSLVKNNSPEDVNIYILDFGSMILKNFEALKHIGGIVLASEDEKMKNLFKFLVQEMDRRKEKLLRAGVSSFYAYRETGKKDMPKIYIMLDNYNTFKELYLEKYEASFIKICRDGISLGISVIVTNAMSNTLGFRHTSNFTNRLCLTCNDKAEYNSLLDRCKLEPENIPGRLLAMKERVVYEAQAFLAYEGEREFERVNAIHEFVEEMNRQYDKYEVAHQIPCIPDVLSRKKFEREFYENVDRQVVPFGLDYATVDPIGIDLDEDVEMTLVAKNKDKIITFLKSFIYTLQQRDFIESYYFYIIDNYKMELIEYKNHPQTQNYTCDSKECENILETVSSWLKARKEQHIHTKGSIKPERQVIIINSKEAMEYISTKSIMEKFNDIMKNYRDFGILFIYSDVDNMPIAYNSPDLLKRIKESKKAYIFEDINKVKIFDIPSSITKEFTKKLSSDEMYVLNGSVCNKVKLISDKKEGVL